MPDPHETARVLARHAGLELDAERLAVVAPILAAWREGCLALNAAMNDPLHAAVVPVTVLRQPPATSKPDV